MNKPILNITVFFLIIFFGLFSVFALFNYYTLKKELLTLTFKTMTNLVKESSKVIEERINTQLSILSAIANAETVKDTNISIENKNKYLASEAKRLGYKEIYFGDLSGNVFTLNGNYINLIDKDYYQEGLKGNPNMSDPFYSSIDNTLTLVYTVPIRDRNAKIIGVLIGATSGNKLCFLSNDIRLGDFGESVIINKQGTYVASYNPQHVINQYNIIEEAKTNPELESLASVHKRMISGETGTDVFVYKGEKKYVAFTPIRGTNWSLAIAVFENEILLSLNPLRNTTIFRAC